MKYWVASLSLLVATSVWAQERYLCVAEMSTGFAFNKQNKSWHSTTFKTDEKFIVRKPLPADGAGLQKSAWLIAKLGDTFPTSSCEKDFYNNETLFCEGLQTFKFSKKTMRFLSGYLIGYWSDDVGSTSQVFSEGQNTPNLTIGKCSPL